MSIEQRPCCWSPRKPACRRPTTCRWRPTPQLSRAVIQALNLPFSVPELQQTVVTSAQGSALRVGVEADTALASQRLSQALAAQMVLNSAALLPGLPTPTAVRQPALPADPLRKDTAQNAALAVLGGLVGGIALAALLAGRERAAHAGAPRFVDGTPVVGVLARDKMGAVLLRDPESVEAEAYRHLQRSLTSIWAAQPYRTLLVSGVSERNGATTTAVNLALAFGQTSVATLLVDGNLRRPGVHRRLGLPNTHGLSDLLTAATPSLEPRVMEHAGIWVMTSGVLPMDPGALLASAQARSTMRSLTEFVGLVIVDTLPLTDGPDTAALAAHCDAVLVVVAARDLERDDVRAELRRLREAGIRLIGAAIANASPRMVAAHLATPEADAGVPPEAVAVTPTETDAPSPGSFPAIHGSDSGLGAAESPAPPSPAPPPTPPPTPPPVQ